MTYSQEHYQSNKASYAARRDRRRNELRAIILAAKSVPCADCEVTYPYYVMDFDHRDPSLKLFTISDAINKGSGLARLQTEIDKCDVVCSNCHRERTHG